MSPSKTLKRIVTPPVASALALPIPVLPLVIFATGSPADAIAMFAFLFLPSVIVSALWFALAAPLVHIMASAFPFGQRGNLILGSVIVGCCVLVPLVLVSGNLIEAVPGTQSAQGPWWVSVAVGLCYGAYLGMIAGACTLAFGRDS